MDAVATKSVSYRGEAQMTFGWPATGPGQVHRIALIGILASSVGLAARPSHAQARKPTGPEVAAIRDCAKRNKDNLDNGERRCLFKLVATSCINKLPKAHADHAEVDCYSLENLIWDDLLNQNYKSLLDTLDDDQKAKARAMQSAWIAYRDTTCQFYYDKIQGTMASMMQAACVTRESARRAMLLDFFSGL
jgi:uncharacterized protein YecT (DUF1311 family)